MITIDSKCSGMMMAAIIPGLLFSSKLESPEKEMLIQIIKASIYVIGIMNRTLNRVELRDTPSGSFDLRVVEIAQIQPKVPTVKKIIIIGKSLNNKIGSVKDTMFIRIPDPQVSAKSCQCLSLSNIFIFQVKFLSEVYRC